MPTIVTMGAMLMCSFGVAPSTLTITPENLVNAGNVPAATIMDNIPMKNIMPFGMCTTQSNPAVAAATAAKLGVATPAACVPVIPAPWTPGSSTVMIKNKPALNSTCTADCTWGGKITITAPGAATTVNVP